MKNGGFSYDFCGTPYWIPIEAITHEFVHTFDVPGKQFRPWTEISENSKQKKKTVIR